MPDELLTRLGLAISAYRPVDVLALLGALQLIPENAARSSRLEALAHVAISAKETGREVPVDASVIANVLNGPPLASSFIQRAEDVPESAFVESFTFHGGGYLVFPGINTDQAYILRHLSKAIFMHRRDWGNPIYPDTAKQVFGALLAISDAIARRAGLDRHCVVPEPDSESVVVPEGDRLAKLMHAVCFGEREFDALLRGRVFSQSFLKPFFVQCGDLSQGQYSLERSAVCSRPLVRVGAEIVVPAPSMLMPGIRNGVVQLAHTMGVADELAGRYADAVWDSLRRTLTVMDHVELDVELPDAPNLPWFREALFQFDVDKVAYCCLVCDSLMNYEFSDPFALATPIDVSDWLARRLARVRAEIASWKHPPRDLLWFVVPQGIGRGQLIKAEALEDAAGGPVVTFGSADLEVIGSVELRDSLTFWKYAREAKRVRLSIEVEGASALNEFGFYRKNGYSYYVSDEKAPVAIALAPGYDGKLKQDFAHRFDRHAVPSFNEGNVVEVLAFYATPSIPIYAPFEPLHECAALVVEGLSHPVWVCGPRWTDENPDTSPHRSICIEWVEAVAYWFWQFLPSIRERGRLLLTSRKVFRVELDLGRLDEWDTVRPGEPTSPEHYVSVRVDQEQCMLFVALHPDCSQLLNTSDNRGEQFIMRRILSACEPLFGSTNPAAVSFDDWVAQCVAQHMTPPHKKKLSFWDGSQRPDADMRNLGPSRRLQKSEDPPLLDALGSYLRTEKGLPVGDIEGPNAYKSQLLNSAVAHLFAQLQSEVAELRPAGLLEMLVSRQEALTAAIANQDLVIPTSLACFSRSEERVKEMREDYRANARTAIAGRFLIEYVAACPSSGSRPISLSVYDRLLNLAMLATDLGFMSDLLRLGLTNTRLGILPSGRLGFDEDAYTSAFRAYMPRSFEGHIRSTEDNLGARWRKRQHRADKPDVMVRMDEAFSVETGHTLTEIVQACGVAIDTGLKDGSAYVVTPVAAFRSEVAGRLGWTSEKAGAIIDLLSLRPREQYLKVERPSRLHDVFPWNFNRPLSHLYRPFLRRMKAGVEQILFGHRHVCRASLYLFNQCVEGRFPARSGELKALMGSFNHARGEAFNDAVYEALNKERKWKVVPRFKKVRIGGRWIRSPFGDVDVLVAIPDARVLVLAECKDLGLGKTPWELRQEIDGLFVDRDGQLSMMSKVVRRERWVKENLSDVCATLGMAASPTWRVRSVVIVDQELVSPHMVPPPVPVVPEWEAREAVGRISRT